MILYEIHIQWHFYKIFVLFCIQQHFIKYCLFPNSKYKWSTITLHNCRQFLYLKVNFTCIFSCYFKTQSKLLSFNNLKQLFSIIAFGLIVMLIFVETREFHWLNSLETNRQLTSILSYVSKSAKLFQEVNFYNIVTSSPSRSIYNYKFHFIEDIYKPITNTHITHSVNNNGLLL